MWKLPEPRIEPIFSALAGGFLSTVKPGKSSLLLIRWKSPSDNIVIIILSVQSSNITTAKLLGKIEGRRRREQQRKRWLMESPTQGT